MAKTAELKGVGLEGCPEEVIIINHGHPRRCPQDRNHYFIIHQNLDNH
tara:strand:+ start:207 stop:350 length:144 start_codon:yes stop_codon:yes gene_type:complete